MHENELSKQIFSNEKPHSSWRHFICTLLNANWWKSVRKKENQLKEMDAGMNSGKQSSVAYSFCYVYVIYVYALVDWD